MTENDTVRIYLVIALDSLVQMYLFDLLRVVLSHWYVPPVL